MTSQRQIVRRIVAGFDSEGRSAVVSDGSPPRTHISSIPGGLACALAWSTELGSGAPDEDPTPAVDDYVPAPGQTRLLIAEFPPASDIDPALIDPAEAERDLNQCLPGLAPLLEADGMHTTPTVDYSILLSGEVWLILEDGSETLIKAGDVVIQNGTRHAWHNKGAEPAVLAAVLIGAK